MKRLLISLLILNVIPVFAADTYVGYRYKTYNLNDMFLLEYGGASIENEQFTTVEFSLHFTDELQMGGALDLSESEQDGSKVMVQIGFKNWLASVEQGKVVGTFDQSGDELDFYPLDSEFSYDYQRYQLSSIDKIGAATYGFAYAKWDQPTFMTVYATGLGFVEFVEPKTNFTFLSAHIAWDPLLYMLQGTYRSKDFIDIGAIIEAGLMTISPEGTEQARAEADLGESVSYEDSTGVGMSTTVNIGHFGMTSLWKDANLAYFIGLDARFQGMYIGDNSGLLNSEQANNKAVADGAWIGYGFGIRALMRF